MELLEIRQLTLDDEDLFLRGLKEWQGEDLDWYTFAWKPGMSHAVQLHGNLLSRSISNGN